MEHKSGRCTALSIGLRCLLGGARLACKKSLRRYVWAPMLLSFILIVALLAVGYAYVQTAVVWVMDFMPHWLDWFTGVLTVLLSLIVLVAASWLFSLLAVMIAGPFLGILSARTEREVHGTEPTQQTTTHALVAAGMREIRKLGYYLPRLLLVLLCSVVPGVNLVAPLLWLLFGSWMLAVQFVDYAAENRGLDFQETIVVLRRDRFAALSFGALVTVSLSIPCGALLAAPAATCGGVLLWRHLTTS